MADIESNIRFGVDTSDAIASIKMLQSQISAFQRQMASSSVANAESARKLRRGLVDDLNATGQWSASIRNIQSSSESFTRSLEKNKLSMGEYFRYAGSQTKTFGGLFRSEFNTIEKVARERVKDLQTQYISLGRDANGALKAISVRPLRLDMESLATQTAMNAQRQQVFNQLLKQGSTNLLNFGKNTQWAGRQLMVGFTIPLSIFGNMASKTFMELEEQAIRFKRVYGDLFTPPEESQQMLETLKELGKEFTKYGVAVEKTLGLAADAAAMGKTGTELLDQVTEANRLAVLGNVEQAQALETTISITNAFGVATEDLAKKIDFLNAVENQTVTSIEDLTIAVPKAGPVIQQLGGDVEDLAFFLTAMKEGGINASEGANALKSGLASIINPTAQASTMLKVFGINLQELNATNRGDVKGLVVDFAEALDKLDPSQRAQAIEQLFGKFQFARLSTLFQNVIQDGTQAQRVLELTNATTQELAQLSSKELKNVEESTTFRFRKAIEEFQLAIAPVGEQFLKLITPIIEFATGIIEKFNGLSDGAKSFITGLTVLFGAIGPLAIMTFGLLANGIANIIKGFTFVRELFMKTGKQSTILGEQLDYMTSEQLNAAAVAASLEQVHQNLIQTFSTEAGAVQRLGDVYRQAFNEQQRFDTGRNIARQAGLRLAKGITSVPGPKGAGDVVPAVLSPGEAVIPAKSAQQNKDLIAALVSGKVTGQKKSLIESFLQMFSPKRGKQSKKDLNKFQLYEENTPFQLASGTTNVPGPRGAGDIVPALLSPGEAVIPAKAAQKYAPIIRGMIAGNLPGFNKGVMLGMPGSGKATQKNRDAAQQIYEMFKQSSFANVPPTEYGHQLSPTSGHSFPIFGLGGVYMGPNGQKVFVKPVMDEKAAIAEMRATEIARRAHGLKAPEQRITVIRDPQDPTRERRFLALESALDASFVNNEPMAMFNEEQYFRQLVASLVRVDKDLSASNVFGDVVADVGPAGVFSKASGLRDYADNLPSMEQQAMINLLGIKGGAKKAFAEATVGLMQNLTPQQYQQRMVGEIQRVLPLLEQTVAGFKLSSPQEAKAYSDMIQRLREGLGVDWTKFHAIHSAVKPSKPKQSIPGYNEGVVSVPGPKGKGDVTPAMLTPGEAVIPADKAKKYAGLIQAMIYGNIPGYRKGNVQRDSSNALQLGHLQMSSGTLDSGERLMGSLVRLMLPAQNKALDGLGQTVEEFTSDWNAVLDGLARTIELGGEKLTKEIIASGREIDAEIRDEAVRLAAERNQLINDPLVAEATDNVLQSNLNKGGPQAAAAQALINTKDMNTIGRATAEGLKDSPFLKQAGIIFGKETYDQMVRELESRGLLEKFTTSGGRNSFRTTEAGAGLVEGRPAGADFARENSRGVAVPQGRRSDGPSYLNLQGKVGKPIIEAIGEDVIQAAQVKSPSRKTAKAAEGMVDGVTETLEQGKTEVAKATQDLVSDGVTKPIKTGPRRASTNPETVAWIESQRRQSEELQGSPGKNRRGNRRASAPQTDFSGVQEAQKRQAESANAVTDSNEEMLKVTQSTTDRLTRLNSVIMNGTFALTSLAGIGIMAGGTIGKVSEMIFQYSGAVFALMQITQTLTQMKIVEFAQNKIAIAQQAMAFATYGAGIAATNTFTGSIFRAAIGINAALGPIGWIVLGLTALAGVIGLIINAQEEQKKKINGLGDTAFLTAEKMKKAGDLLGFQPKTTAFGQNITAGTAAARGSQEASMISELRSSDSFKADFAGQIDAIKKATDGQAEAVLASVSNQLFSAGASKEQVDAYVRAIAQEAGKTSLSFSFANIDFEKEGAAQISSVAKKSADTFSKAFTDGITFATTSEWVANAQSANPFDGDWVRTQTTDISKISDEARAAASTFAKTSAASFQSLKDGLANGLISAEDFNSGLGGVMESLNGLNADQLGLVLPDLYTSLGLEKTMASIPNVKDQLLILQADAAGITLNDGEIKALQNANKKDIDSQKAANRVRALITKQVRDTAKAQEDLNNKKQEEALINEQIASANVALTDRVVQLDNQRKAYDFLIEQGYTAAQAFDLAGDAGLAAGIKAATGAGVAASEWTAMKNLIDQVINLEKNAPKNPTAGGAGDKSPLQQAIDSLKEQRKEILQSNSAFTKLRKAGFDTSSAMKAAEDPILAAALATTKVGTKQWTDLITRIKETQRLLSKKEMQDLLRGGKVEIAERRAQATVSNALTTLGYTAEQIDEVLSDQEFTNTLAEDLKDGKINATEALQRLSQIKQLGNIDVEIAFATKEGAAEEFQKRYDKVTGFLESQKQVIEVNFQLNTFKDSVIIRKAEEEIAAIQYKIDNYEAQLTGIEDQENVINEAYDERKKALDDVAKANDVISRQQKNQLTLADALSQGDIAAAAKAAQEMRAQSAQDSIAKQGDQLQLAKEQQLANLRSADGRSRKQIEDDIKKLKKDIFKIEEERLEPARENIRLAEVEKNGKLDSINQQILRWDVLSAKVNEAKLRLTPAEMTAMEYQAKLIADLLDNWNKIEDKQAILTIIKKTIDEANGVTKETSEKDVKLNDTEIVSKNTSEGTGGSGNGSLAKSETENSLQAFKDSGKNIAGFVKQLDASVVNSTLKTKENLAKVGSVIGKSSSAGESNRFDNLLKASKVTSNNLAKAGSLVDKTSSSAGETNRFSNLLQSAISKPSVAQALGLGALSGSGVPASLSKQTTASILQSKGVKLAMGGMVKRYAAGGFAMGTDIIPSMLTPGEFVVRRNAVNNFGVDKLKAINSGTYNGDSVYNYEVNINVQTNSNADQIASSVIGKIKQIDSQRIKGNRF